AYCFAFLPFAALSCLALRHQQRNEIMKKFFTSVKSSLAAAYYATHFDPSDPCRATTLPQDPFFWSACSLRPPMRNRCKPLSSPFASLAALVAAAVALFASRKRL
ncbi:hypothetical protein, partial [Pigmentiphaga sp.]|uniref:hypothetical protein n=1 Tax=Pigmentiphaga sp. TaxID=1977564 RepID=UPI0025FC2634